MSTKRYARSVYPWDKWFKVGSKHTLVKGTDFKCSIRSMIVYLYVRAKHSGVRISVTDLGKNKLKVETFKKDKERKRA